MHKKNKKGFTLVEIMIVVVIIGLLAAMAIPAFQKVRESSITKTVGNDARQIGHAAQQYFMESGVSEVSIAGALLGTETDKYIKNLSDKVTVSDDTISTATDDTFSLTHPLVGTLTFNNEGEPTGE